MTILQKSAILQEAAVECKGEQIFHARHFINHLLATEQDAHRVLVTALHLEHHLAAGATGRNGLVEEGAIGATGGYGKSFNGLVGVTRIGVEEGGSLGTEARRVGGILLVAATNQRTIGQAGRCAN